MRISSRLLALTVPIVLAAGGAGAMSAGATDPDLGCQILATTDGHSIILEGIVDPGLATGGSYLLQVEKHGPAGSAKTSQGGVFNAAGGVRTSVGKVMLGGAGGTIDATLTLSVNGREVDCRQAFASAG